MPIPPAIVQGISLSLSDSMKSELEIVMTHLQHEFQVRHRILDLALNQWMAYFGRVEIVAMQVFLDAFFPPNDHSRISSKQTNCQFLLGSCTPHSRFFRNQVSFTDFFRLFLRYGSSNGFHETFDAITPSDSGRGDPCFCDGFCLGWDIATISSLLRPGDWAIVEGNQLGTFSLMTNTILIIHVDPSDDLHHFTFKTSNGEQHSARSWMEFLPLTELDPEHGLHVHVSSSSRTFLRASRKRQLPTSFFDLNDTSFSSNFDDWNNDDR
jgi:hypothetical protein